MNNPGETARLPATNLTPKPGDFPIRSAASRAAARAMLERREDAFELHIEIVGFGDSPACGCRACRRKWSRATQQERAAAMQSLENYLDRACGRTRKVQEQLGPLCSVEPGDQTREHTMPAITNQKIVIPLEAVPIEELQTPQGRLAAREIHARNMDKLRPHVLTGGISASRPESPQSRKSSCT